LASEIASKLKLHRTTAYYILENLIRKGLVSYVIKSGKKYFEALQPEKILDLEKEKISKIEKFVQEIKLIREPLTQKPHIEVFEGIEGIKTIWEDVLRSLKSGEEILIMATGRAPQTLPYYMPNFHTRRIEKKIGIKIIYNETKYTLSRGSELEKQKHVKVKYISKKYLMPVSTLVYFNKTAFMMWNKDHIMGMIIQDTEMHSNFKNQFKMLWEIAK